MITYNLKCTMQWQLIIYLLPVYKDCWTTPSLRDIITFDIYDATNRTLLSYVDNKSICASNEYPLVYRQYTHNNGDSRLGPLDNAFILQLHIPNVELLKTAHTSLTDVFNRCIKYFGNYRSWCNGIVLLYRKLHQDAISKFHSLSSSFDWISLHQNNVIILTEPNNHIKPCMLWEMYKDWVVLCYSVIICNSADKIWRCSSSECMQKNQLQIKWVPRMSITHYQDIHFLLKIVIFPNH